MVKIFANGETVVVSGQNAGKPVDTNDRTDDKVLVQNFVAFGCCSRTVVYKWFIKLRRTVKKNNVVLQSLRLGLKLRIKLNQPIK